MNAFNFILTLFAILTLATACASTPEQQPPGTPGQQGPPQTPGEQSAAPSGATGPVKEFTIRAFQFGYEPSTIEVNVGDTVRISAFSSDVPHGLRIREYNVNMAIQDSTPVTAEFVADKAGTFPFSCSIPCGAHHRNMSGTLIVKP